MLQTYGIRNKRSKQVEVMTYVDYVEMHGPAWIAGMRRGQWAWLKFVFSGFRQFLMTERLTFYLHILLEWILQLCCIVPYQFSKNTLVQTSETEGSMYRFAQTHRYYFELNGLWFPVKLLQCIFCNCYCGVKRMLFSILCLEVCWIAIKCVCE